MIGDLDYHRPDTLAEASRLALAGDAAFLAGGQALLRDMKRGLRRHAAVIDIGRLVGRVIRAEADAVVIEAGATHAEVAGSAVVRGRLPMLAALVGHIGDPPVRHRATIGGALAGDEPAGDYPAAALALGATIVTPERAVAADALLAGAGGMPLERGEVIVAVSFPVPRRAGYAKILNPASRYAMVGACAAVGANGAVRLAVTGAGTNGAFRWVEGEAALAGRFASDALAGLAPPPVAMREDLFADAAYRAHLIGVMARRAIAAADGHAPVRVYSHGGPIRDDRG